MMARPERKCAPKAAVWYGAHFFQPRLDSRVRSAGSLASAVAPFSPMAPISEPPNHAPAVRSWMDRATRLPAMVSFLSCEFESGMVRPHATPHPGHSKHTYQQVGSPGFGPPTAG